MTIFIGCRLLSAWLSKFVRLFLRPSMDLHRTTSLTSLVRSTVVPRRRELRSSAAVQLNQPSHQRRFAERAFAVAGPVLWNALPSVFLMLRLICLSSSLKSSFVYHRVQRLICMITFVKRHTEFSLERNTNKRAILLLLYLLLLLLFNNNIIFLVPSVV